MNNEVIGGILIPFVGTTLGAAERKTDKNIL